MATTTPSHQRMHHSSRLPAPDRKRQLLEISLSLFADRGFAKTTMDDIAIAAGVTKPILYQHFSSKRALYGEIVDAVTLELLETFAKATADASGPRDLVERGLAAFFDFVGTHEQAFLLIYNRDPGLDADLGDPVQRVERVLIETVDPLIDAGLEPEHRRVLAAAIVAMAEGVARNWLAGGIGAPDRNDPNSSSQLARRVADLAWAGLRSVHAD